ncbi:uncharacterized protein F4807DRAFT_453631 [Annulohypoxylon truncatum]|uniref:uncharacterized protein n=1 Tax=Annulohypoxylon truncatum TaxID=327061 RepID=UPI002007C46D|nr:uncharacterized protein F4807DRAFT_453631 [Annulohypoxylon truncatum]KAI1206006.1 hypothetical protein F4807DRAFT_453631 [Annulohypoxylon truncatum]
MSHGWRPKYLRRRVVIAFNVCFSLLIITLEVLDGISIRNQGFVFVGSIALTLILAFWARFEYQACRYLPWMILARQPQKSEADFARHNDAARTIALDYAGMWTPNAMITAAKNKHFLVLSALTVSMLLRVQIVLSASLFYTHLVSTKQDVEVRLQDRFLDRVNIPFNPLADPRPFRLESGNWTTRLDYPQSLVPDVALQRFEDKAMHVLENSTALTVTVDGLTISSSCKNPTVSIIPAKNGRTNFTISSHHSIPSRSFQLENIYPEGLLRGPYLLYYWEDTSYANDSSEPFYVALVIGGKVDDAGKANFQTTALSCTLDVSISPFEVTMENAKLSAVRRPGTESTVSIRGGLLDYMWRSYDTAQIYAPDLWIGSGICGGLVVGDIMDYDATPYLETDLIPFKVGGRLLKDGRLNGSDFANPSTLEGAMALYHSAYGSKVAHYDFRKPINSSANGFVTRDLSRLGVQPYISQIMVGLFGLTMVITLPLLWEVSPKNGFVPFKPRTLAGMAILLSRSYEFLEVLNGRGHQSVKKLLEHTKGAYYTSLVHHPSTPLYPSFQLQRLKSDDGSRTEAPAQDVKTIDWYQPWTLRPISRAISLLAMIGFLATLVALLQSSLRHGGLGDAIGSSSSHYLWTSLPSLLFVCLSTYFGSCDSELRSLAPFALLSSSAVTYSEGLTLSFVDQTAARTLLISLKKRNLVVIFSTSIVLLCSLLPIFTANLFTVQMRSVSKPVTLQQVEWLTPKEFELEMSNIPDLILNLNLSYPSWTFEDLVIPRYQLAEPVSRKYLQPNSTVTSRLRAARAVLDCNHTTSIDDVTIDIWGKKTTYHPSGLIICPISDTGGPFGIDALSLPWLCDRSTDMEGWPSFIYAWGQCQGEGWGNGSHATVMVCNETFEEVEVQVTLSGPNLEILENYPPVLTGSSGERIAINFHESISQTSNPTYNISDPYANLIDDQGLDHGLFSTLTSSRYAIPGEWLGDTSRTQDVIAAIKKVHGIVRAQMLRDSTGAWLYLNDTSANTSFVAQEKLPVPPVDGEMWQILGRVMQDQVATCVLIGLLAVILLLDVILVWLSEAHGYRRAVPKSPGTIVAVASLFANSTFFGHLPSNAQWTTNEKLEQQFEGKRFRMGWYSDNDMNEAQVYTIGVI